MSKNNVQSDTLYGPGGDNPATLKDSSDGEDTLKNMAEMMSPEERTQMISILQQMQKQDRMSGTLSADDTETPKENSNEVVEE